MADEQVNEAQGSTQGYPIPRGYGARINVESPYLVGTATEQAKAAEGVEPDVEGAVVNVSAPGADIGSGETSTGRKNTPRETEAKASAKAASTTSK